jgi:sugar phosphate isomerase/epimerase
VIGIASPSFCFQDFSRMLEEISRQFQLWEVLVEGGHTIEKVEPVMAELAPSYDMRFQVHGPMSDVNIGSVYERMRLAAVDDIVRTAEFCRRQNIQVLTIHPAFITGIAFLDRPSVVSQMKKSLKSISGAAAESSVTIALENMPKGINATCTTAAELIEALEGTELGVCFDMGHANTAGQVDALLEHVDMFRNVHLHNNDGSWDQHDRVDQGSADLPMIMASIDRGGYDGNLIVESSDLDSGVSSKRVLASLLE